MKKFLESVAASALRLSSYKEFVARELGWRYILLFTLLVAFLASVFLAVSITVASGRIIADITKNLPDFTAELKDGKFTLTGVAQPLIFPNPEGEGTLIIDSADSVKNLDAVKTGILLNSTKILIKNTEAGAPVVRETLWKEEKIREGTYTKAFVLETLRKIRPFLAPVGVVGGTAALWLLIFVGSAVFAAAWSVVGFISARVAKMKLTFAQVLAVAFHALTVPIIVSFVFGIAGLRIPFLPTIIFLVYFVGALKAIQKDTTSSSVLSAPSGGAGA